MVTADMPLSAVLEKHTSLIPLVGRFGIKLGQGERTIEQVCKDCDISTDFLLTIMNTFLFEDYFPEQRLKEFHISQIENYLTTTADYYRNFQLPNIEHHLNVLVKGADKNSRLTLIQEYFNEFKRQILSQGGLQDEQQVSDLVSIMIRHLGGEYNTNMAYAVIFSLESLAKDIRQHNRIRNRILNR